jgi:hypothetical protein
MPTRRQAPQRQPAAALLSVLRQQELEAPLEAALRLLRAGPVELEWQDELDDLWASVSLGEAGVWLVYLGNVGNWLCERAEGGRCPSVAAKRLCPHLLAALVALVQTRSLKLGDLRTRLALAVGPELGLASALEALRAVRRDGRKSRRLSRLTTQPDDFAGL